jgi:hypothetical protein
MLAVVGLGSIDPCQTHSMKRPLGRDKIGRPSPYVKSPTSVDTDETKVWVGCPSVLWLRPQPDAYCSDVHRRQS